MALKRGAFIVLEGCDRCGKSTQCKQIVSALTAEGIKAEAWRFPDRTTAIGKMIDSYLKQTKDLDDHAIHLLFSANRWEAVHHMTELINSGTTLIVDRYSYSGVAFSASKNTMEMDWCKNPERGLPQPDAVLFLQLSVEEAAKRGQFGNERYETTGIQAAVAENYEALKEDYWIEVDANNTVEGLNTKLMEIVKDTIKNIKDDQPVKQLWVK